MADRFIKINQMRELQEASKNGNPQAKNILDKYMERRPDMESVYRLIDEYYKGIPTQPVQEEPIVKPDNAQVIEEKAEPVEEKAQEDVAIIPDEGKVESQIDAIENADCLTSDNVPVDISADLDRELDGLIDNEDVEDLSFSDFLGNKKRDALRSRKNHDYFNAFDQAGRESYLAKKKDEYGHGFDNKRRQIERNLTDINNALDVYSNFVTDSPEDNVEIDMDMASKAYEDLTGDESAMGAFGRSWDAQDNESIKAKLLPLIQTYGKKNVMAVLNNLREDAHAWATFSNGKIDHSVNAYGKAMDDLLK